MGKAQHTLFAALALSICPALAIPAHADLELLGVNGNPLQIFNRRADDDFDPWDLSSIKKIAAIGDSYSAGIGAGTRISEDDDPKAKECSRYDHSYPYLVNKDSALGDSSKRKFQFLSCSGALSKEVEDEQVGEIEDGQDVIMLSAGGNDAGLADILNQCVFQIFAPNKVTAGLMQAFPAIKAIEWLSGGDLNKYARSCEETLADSQKTIEDEGFSKQLDSLLSKTKKKLGDKGTIYYTGYAQFWDADMSDGDQCSKTDWSVLMSHMDKWSFQEPVKLTVDRRKKMNDLVSLVNKKISEAVERAGPQVVFVDYDWYIRSSGGQFCKKGVKEPNPSREGLKFYELDIKNPQGTSPFKRDGSDVYEGTFENDINRFGLLARTVGSELKDDALPDEKMGEEKDKSGRTRATNPLPDGYGRIFHPTISAHKDIASYLVYNIVLENGAKHKKEAKPKEIDVKFDWTCPLHPEVKPKCEQSLTSGVSYKIFADVYGDFCKQVDKKSDESLNWTVDSKGKKISDKKRDLEARTPPPGPDDAKGVKFALKWEPEQSSKRDSGLQPRRTGCEASCKEAYQEISKACGHTAGEGESMAAEAEASVGCGKYSYEITGPDSPDKKDAKDVKRKCYDVKEWGDKEHNTNDKIQNILIERMCDKVKDKKLKAGDDTLELGLEEGKYYYSISWMDNCMSTVDEVNVGYPLGRDEKNNCWSLLRYAYKMCEGENDGYGGWYEVGCLKYEFAAHEADASLKEFGDPA